MSSRFLYKTRIDVLVVTGLALGWSVFAYGAVADGYRTLAVVLTALAGGWALVRLPGPGKFPRLPLVAGVAGAVLLLYGWFMVANAVAEHSTALWEFTGVSFRLADWAPGSVARSTSLRSMLELSAVLVAFLAAMRAAQSGAWRTLLAMLAILGALVALTGILHKATGAEAVWFTEHKHPRQFFAPFVYHATAGQFMNLTLPLAFGMWLSGAFDEERPARSGFWATVTAVTMGGILMTASKGAIGILAVSLLLLLALNRRRLRTILAGAMRRRGRRTERLVFLVAMLVLLTVLSITGIAMVVSRWGDFIRDFDREGGPLTISGRLKSIEILLRMAAPSEGSWHGFGPGTYRHLFPYFTVEDRELTVRFLHAHCDPLQTVVEWGYLGAAAWFALGIGAVTAACLLLVRRPSDAGDAPILRGMVIGLVLSGVHSTMDFPFSMYSVHLAAMLICGICWGLWAARPRGGSGKCGPDPNTRLEGHPR